MAYKIFISHAYDHQDIYFDLVQKLNGERRRFDWRNVSVQFDMRHGEDGEEIPLDRMRELIGSRVADCDVMLALTKPIATRRQWLQWEILRAKELGKPVIGISRRRNDRVSSFVRAHADEIVDTWVVAHIIEAIELLVEESRSKPRPLTPLPADRLPPLAPEQPDEAVDIEPSPDRLHEEAIEPSPVVATSERPRDVLFQADLGPVVPGPPVFLQPARPRWWHRFTRRSV